MRTEDVDLMTNPEISRVGRSREELVPVTAIPWFPKRWTCWLPGKLHHQRSRRISHLVADRRNWGSFHEPDRNAIKYNDNYPRTESSERLRKVRKGWKFTF